MITKEKKVTIVHGDGMVVSLIKIKVLSPLVMKVREISRGSGDAGLMISVARSSTDCEREVVCDVNR